MSTAIAIKPEMVNFVGIRVRYSTTKSFDAVLSALRSTVGETSIENIIQLSVDTATRQDFEKALDKYVGPSGLMLFAEINHGLWIQKFGIKRRLLRWIVGNPLIAISMIEHDPTAALFIPFDLLLAENEDGAGCTITYAVPSSLVKYERNPELRSASEVLDTKIEKLVVEALNAPHPSMMTRDQEDQRTDAHFTITARKAAETNEGGLVDPRVP